LNKPERILAVCRQARDHGIDVPLLQTQLAELTSSREEAITTARNILNRAGRSSEWQAVRSRCVAVLLRHGEHPTATTELVSMLPDHIVDTDDHFLRFSTLAVTSANVGAVKTVLGPIEKLAPSSDRWFRLWVDLTQISSVDAEIACRMLQQAGQWSSTDDPKRSKLLFNAWRKLGHRTSEDRCHEEAFVALDSIITSESPPDEQMVVAGLAWKTGRSDKAIALYDRIAKHSDGSPQLKAIAFNNLASLKLMEGVELSFAAEMASKAMVLQERPEFVDTLVEIRLRMNQKEDALQLLEDGIRQWPNNSRLKRLAARLKTTPAE